MTNSASTPPINGNDNNSDYKPLPSDAFVRKVLKRIPLVRILFKLVLGPEKAAMIDWSSLKAADSALVTSTLKRRNLDLLFSVKYLDYTNLNLMLVFEHKSYIPAKDKSPLLQLLKYEVSVYEALEDYRREENVRRRKANVPPIDEPMGGITSVLFYHGKRPWKALNWKQWTGFDQLPNEKQLIGIKDYSYSVCDISKMTNDELINFFSQSADLMLMALFTRHSYLKKLDAAKIDSLLKLAYNTQSANEGFSILDELSAYISEMVEPHEEEDVIKVVNKYDENLKHKLMSIAEARELRGIEKGIEQGIVAMLKSGKLVPGEIASLLDVPLQTVKEIKQKHHL